MMNEPTMLDGIEELGVFERDSDAWVDSQDVARRFEKRHADVIRAVEKAIAETSADITESFKLVQYNGKKGGGRKAYQMNRRAFIYLVMGFTGDKASKFKAAYIEGGYCMMGDVMQESNVKEISDWGDVFDFLFPYLIGDIDREAIKDNFVTSQSSVETGKEMGFVYLIENPISEMIKIGYTKDLENRTRTISSFEGDVKTIRVFQFDDRKDAYRFEQCLHNLFKDYRQHGEWFCLGQSQLNQIDAAQKQNGQLIRAGLSGDERDRVLRCNYATRSEAGNQ